MKNEIDEQIYRLFTQTFGSFSTSEYNAVLDDVDRQISEFGWKDTFDSWLEVSFL